MLIIVPTLTFPEEDKLTVPSSNKPLLAKYTRPYSACSPWNGKSHDTKLVPKNNKLKILKNFK